MSALKYDQRGLRLVSGGKVSVSLEVCSERTKTCVWWQGKCQP